MFTTSLVYSSGLASNAAGIISQVFDQTMTGLTGWAYLGAAYDEFRVLAFQVEYFPNNRYSKTLVTCAPGFGVVDRDSNGALISTAQAIGYSSVRILSLEDPWTDSKEYRGSSVPSLKWNMSSVTDGTFLTTAAPTPSVKAAIKLFFSGLTASTQYGLIVQRVLVQFRGKII